MRAAISFNYVCSMSTGKELALSNCKLLGSRFGTEVPSFGPSQRGSSEFDFLKRQDGAAAFWKKTMLLFQTHLFSKQISLQANDLCAFRYCNLGKRLFLVTLDKCQWVAK